MNRSTEPHSAVLESLEARLGVRLAAGLSERAAALPHDLAERLRVSRELALARARSMHAQQAAGASTVVGATAGGAAVLGGGRLWVQVASWLPLVVLVVGLLLIQRWIDREQVLAAAEIDAVLLADDLPPAAWADPGFREYLKAPQP